MQMLLKTATKLSFLFMLSACSYTTIGPPSVAASIDSAPTILALGEVKHANGHFYEGLKDGLSETPSVKVITNYSLENYGTNAFTLRGNLKVIERDGFGEKVSRHLVGFGFNRREVQGIFEVDNSNHDTVLSFAATEYYNGGTGLGGLLDVPGWIIGPFVEGIPFFTQTDIISTDTMQRRLGIEVGKQVREWLSCQHESIDK